MEYKYLHFVNFFYIYAVLQTHNDPIHSLYTSTTFKIALIKYGRSNPQLDPYR